MFSKVIPGSLATMNTTFRTASTAAERDVDFDVNRLVAVTADLLDHARNRPDLLARDRSMINDSIQQLTRMLDRLKDKVA